MSARARTAEVALVVWFLALGPAAAADWEMYLAKPLSPGSVALLVQHSTEPRVLGRWAQALKDPRPEVRAAAARAINVTSARNLLSDVGVALAAEPDEAAAIEEIRALATLGAGEPELQAAAQRDPRLQWFVTSALEGVRRALDAPARPAAAQPAVTSRIPGGYPPGLVTDVMKVAGCAGQSKEDFHGGEVEYGPEGRPRRVALLPPGRHSVGCVDAVTALLLLALGSASDRSSGQPQLVVVPLAPDSFACMGEPVFPEERPGGSQRVGGHIQEPKKVKNVAPWYPPAAMAERVQGIVVLEATIAASGCVASVRTLRSADRRLEVVSLLTSALWRYTPTLLDGKPVPAIMTITVNFRLR
jgi:TonB family protein